MVAGLWGAKSNQMNQRNLFDTQTQIGDQLIDMDAERFSVNHQHRIKTHKNETGALVYLKTSDGEYKSLMPGETLTLTSGWITKVQNSGKPWTHI